MSPALLAMPGALRTIPRSGRFQDCEHVSAGKPRAFPLAPAAGERSIRAEPQPTPGGTWRSVCDRRGPTSPSRCRLRLTPRMGLAGKLIPRHCAAAVQSLACFRNKEVPNFNAVGSYSQIPSETLALAADGGVSPEH